jgi:hypothetical protein
MTARLLPPVVLLAALACTDSPTDPDEPADTVVDSEDTDSDDTDTDDPADETTPITFSDIASDPASGLSGYANSSALRESELVDATGQELLFHEWIQRPYKQNSSPGIAIFDYDDDGDLDLYVTNGPNTPNSLYQNQLVETGTLTFVDVAAAAGVTATVQESSGTVAGDLDNDGDQDLLVLGIVDENILYANNGDGTFTDVTTTAGIAGFEHSGSASATLADFDGDGLLDIYVGNGHDLDDYEPIFAYAPEVVSHNHLFMNRGGLVFEDTAEDAGLYETKGHTDAAGNNLDGIPGISWAVAAFDYDGDGDIDIFSLDDQGAVTPAAMGGHDTGIIHVWENDGSANFVDRTVDLGLVKTGAWMGIAVADFDSDSHLDFFATNFGDVNASLALNMPMLGAMPSRWFMGSASGGFTDAVGPQGLPGVVTLPFGWGTSAFDYDNDGDTDILYHGDMDDGIEFLVSNPGVLLANDGQANFTADLHALSTSVDHLHRNVTGLATGDLDGDGFVDVVTVSSTDIPPTETSDNTWGFGGPYDDFAAYVHSYVPQGDIFNGAALVVNPATVDFPDGSLAVEINSASTGHGWVAVALAGSVGTLTNGRVNRDGFGAILTFTPDGGQPVKRPLMGGSSFSSMHSQISNFGLGEATAGTVDVTWPGGVTNRLYDVQSGETVTVPEIPCSIDTDDDRATYVACVDAALASLVTAGLEHAHADRLGDSAERAYDAR